MDSNILKQSPHDLLRLLFRHKSLFLATSAVFMIAVMVVGHFLPLKYTGQAIFEFGLETAAEQISKTSSESFNTIKERLQHDVGGTQAIETAAGELGLLAGLPHDAEGKLTAEGKAIEQRMIEKFSKEVEVSWEARSNKEDLVSVKFTDQNPKIAEQMPNALIAGYINRTAERIRSGLKVQHDFLKSKVEDGDKIMDELTRKRIAFETQHAGLLPENPAALQEKIQRVKTDLESLRRQSSVATANLARLQSLKQQMASPDKVAQVIRHPNPQLDQLQRQLSQLQDELENNLTVKGMTKNHPLVQTLEQKIAQVQKRLKETPPEAVKETVFASVGDTVDLTMRIAAAESELEMTGNETKRLEATLGSYEKLWSNFAPVREEYLRFMKEWDDRNGEASSWRGRLESVEVALAAVVNNRLTHLKAIQHAQEQIYPSSPAIYNILAIGIAGGLIFGAAAVFLAKILDRTINSSEEASSYLDLPVQGVICEIMTPRENVLRAVKRWALWPAVAAMTLIVLGLSVMSMTLRLENPQLYGQWKAHPMQFIEWQLGEPKATAFNQ